MKVLVRYFDPAIIAVILLTLVITAITALAIG